MPYPIERGIPIPPKWATRRPHAGGEHGKFLWHVMEPGDSFLVPFDGDDPIKVRQRVQAASGRRRFETYTTRLEPTGVRIWRVA